ncbi:MAG: AIPR family protein [Verrucomicrobia bacterium]|nr:AIPR family protein [Verrucomicrobiota bacterium]
MELTELANYLDEEVQAACAGDKNIEGPEDGFTEVMLTYLAEGNEVDAWELGYAKKTGRRNAPAFKINAWNLHEQGGDQESSAPLLDLFVSIYKPGATGQSVSKSEVAEHFELARSFLSQSLTAFGGKLNGLEESAPPYEATTKIYTHRDDLDTARIFLLTNGVVKAAEEKDAEIGGIDVKHYLWDLEKLRRLLSSGQERETIQIDLVKSYGGAVPCLAQEDGTGEYTAYLAFFPAALLAKIYGDYGPRLLEKNVRSFLQAKGKVNKGIQTTIREQPHRFLAYNNGISGTAEAVTVSKSKDGSCKLEHLRDFQIVNGGQTTASIYHAMKKEKADISHVTVQVKLTVVKEAAKLVEFVPLISRFANSQNSIKGADFSANDEWHQKLENFSRTVWAPAASGTGKGTRWYYERARGSHLDDKMRAGTPARQKAWETENPVFQKFTKTDVAKYEQTWNQLPHAVSKGAEKNFIEWTLSRARTSPPTQKDFERLAAKAILFRTTEKLVSRLEQGGYRANVVAYSLAWLARETAGRLDLDAIWRRQNLDERLCDAITEIAKQAFDHLKETAGSRNVTEWAKKPECWESFQTTTIKLTDLKQFNTKGESNADTDEHNASTQATASSWAQLYEVIQRHKPSLWQDLATWGGGSGHLKNWQVTMCGNFHRKLERGKKPTFPECKAVLEILEAARAKGFTH